MKDYIAARVLELAKYVITSKATVRKAAAKFGCSKSTVHKDLTERLQDIDPELFKQVREVLEFNKAERHLRGGKATKLKYLGETYK